MKNIALALLTLVITSTALESQIDISTLENLKFRNIGPFRGGRSTGSCGVIGDPLTYYMTTTGGGLWKTSDAGVSWHNISDGYFKTGSVGAVSVSQSDPNIVYVGMGEHAPRGVMTSYGDGVYRSDDAGETWVHLGLEKTRHISRIIIHPKDPNTLWVAAQGALHGTSKERGIYKSTDGGKTWSQTLYINERTGCSDLSIDSKNPQVLYAGMWDHIRKPWQVVSGGAGSGFYKSIDGGETWKELKTGFPQAKGKTAIAVSPANSSLVYALLESDSQKEQGGLFVSKNGGKSFKKISGDHRLIQRAWYYIEVTPDPNNENTVYVLSASFYKSIDGGKTWEEVQTHHGDYHDLWINPNNSQNMVVSDDGGAEITFNGGESWSKQDHMPTAQIYRINTDNLFPFNIYGGQQDNSSIKIASTGIGSGNINRSHWSSSAGGESAFLAFDKDNPTKVMGGSYLGTIHILDTESRLRTNVMIEPRLYLGLEARKMKYLYNWNAPIIKSMHEPNTWYHCAQYVLRSKNDGQSWDVVSDDLTYNDDNKQGNGGGPLTNEAVGAENYGTIAYMIESPHESGVFYTGSDDGKVYKTRDNCASWQDITPKMLGETNVNAIEVSPTHKGTLYLAATRYKFNDFSPSLYKSTDYGTTWKNISNGLPYGACTRVVREDPGNPEILYAGTETGLYLSTDGGNNWAAFQLNLPITPITDLACKDGKLVVATSGRSFWILDDLFLIHDLINEKEDNWLSIAQTTLMPNWGGGMNSQDDTGTDLYHGVNPASGVVMYYAFKQQNSVDSPITLKIYDEDDNLVRTLTSEESDFEPWEGGPPPPTQLPKASGTVQKFVWDMRYEGLPGVDGVYIEGSYSGRLAKPGTYKATLDYGDCLTYSDGSISGEFDIVDNPMVSTTDEQWEEYHTWLSDGESKYREMTEMVNAMHTKKKRLESIQTSHLKQAPKEIKQTAQGVIAELELWDSQMTQRLSQAYDDVENYVNGFTAEYITAINEPGGISPRVTEGARSLVLELNQEWEEHKAIAEKINARIKELNKMLYDAGIGAIH